jgi:hypothetical protein
MKNNSLFFPLLISSLLFTSACTTAPIINDIVESPTTHETLYVYEDGQMKLNSRYIDSRDVVIYSDGLGGEKAAVKVRVPIHSDFYRDSIKVVRVENNFEESVTQNEPESVDNIN